LTSASRGRSAGNWSRHDVRTIREMGWAGKNGELLALMGADGFDVLLTVDQNIRHQ